MSKIKCFYCKKDIVLSVDNRALIILTGQKWERCFHFPACLALFTAQQMREPDSVQAGAISPTVVIVNQSNSPA